VPGFGVGRLGDAGCPVALDSGCWTGGWSSAWLSPVVLAQKASSTSTATTITPTTVHKIACRRRWSEGARCALSDMTGTSCGGRFVPRQGIAHDAVGLSDQRLDAIRWDTGRTRDGPWCEDLHAEAVMN
jgi:hypothetical protein